MVLTLQSVDDNAFEVIRKLGYEPVYNNKEIMIRVEHTDDVQKILSAIKDAGTLYLGLDIRKPNLEEVFLKLTGETLHDDYVAEKGAK
jgi:ABC-2 type transport system ATP-binding protein